MTDGTYKLILSGYCILITGTIDILTIFEHIAIEIPAMQFDHNRSQQDFISNTPLHSGIIHKAANSCRKNSSNRYSNVVKYKNKTGSNTYYFNLSD